MTFVPEKEKDYDWLEKVAKNKFTMMTRNLKLSKIQSFKGWEAPTVICIIQQNSDSKCDSFISPELIYTGISRAKENLLVINIGDSPYHEFFKNNMR